MWVWSKVKHAAERHQLGRGVCTPDIRSKAFLNLTQTPVDCPQSSTVFQHKNLYYPRIFISMQIWQIISLGLCIQTGRSLLRDISCINIFRYTEIVYVQNMSKRSLLWKFMKNCDFCGDLLYISIGSVLPPPFGFLNRDTVWESHLCRHPVVEVGFSASSRLLFKEVVSTITVNCSTRFWFLPCSWGGPRQVPYRDTAWLQPVLPALQGPALDLTVQRQQVPLAALQPEQEDRAHWQHEPWASVAFCPVGDGRAARAAVTGRPSLTASFDAAPRTAGSGGGLSGGGQGEPPSVWCHPLGGPSSWPAGAFGRAGAGQWWFSF